MKIRKMAAWSVDNTQIVRSVRGKNTHTDRAQNAAQPLTTESRIRRMTGAADSIPQGKEAADMYQKGQ